MKVSDLFEALYSKSTDKGYNAPGFDPKAKNVTGTVKDWMARIGADQSHMKAAIEKAKSLPSYKELTGLVGDVTTPGAMKNGTFNFKHPKDPNKAQYRVSANGQIRSTNPSGWSGEDAPSRMTSPKPRLVHGDPTKSIVNMYDQAFKELSKKAKNALKKQQQK